MSILLSHSVDQSTIRNDRLNKNRIYNDIVKPNLKHDSKRIHSDAKSTDSKTQEVEMTDVTLSPTRNNETRRSTNDSAISFVNDQTNTELQDNENLLPSAITDEVIPIMDEDTPRAFNVYRIKKLLSHGMMDVALFSANANQLRYILESGEHNAFYIICVILLLISIFLQILVGVALLLSARYNVTNCEQREMAFKMGNYVIVGIFLITVVNVFITSFGGPSLPSTILLPMETNGTQLPDLISP